MAKVEQITLMAIKTAARVSFFDIHFALIFKTPSPSIARRMDRMAHISPHMVQVSLPVPGGEPPGKPCLFSGRWLRQTWFSNQYCAELRSCVVIHDMALGILWYVSRMGGNLCGHNTLFHIVQAQVASNARRRHIAQEVGCSPPPPRRQ